MSVNYCKLSAKVMRLKMGHKFVDTCLDSFYRDMY